MSIFCQLLVSFFEYGIFIYCMGVLSSYLVISFISSREVFSYVNKRKRLEHEALISSPFQPSISIIAPAYNESVTSIILSLLSS